MQDLVRQVVNSVSTQAQKLLNVCYRQEGCSAEDVNAVFATAWDLGLANNRNLLVDSGTIETSIVCSKSKGRECVEANT